MNTEIANLIIQTTLHAARPLSIKELHNNAYNNGLVFPTITKTKANDNQPVASSMIDSEFMATTYELCELKLLKETTDAEYEFNHEFIAKLVYDILEAEVYKMFKDHYLKLIELLMSKYGADLILNALDNENGV